MQTANSCDSEPVRPEPGRPAAEPLDQLRRRDFDRLAAFVHSYSGIKMPPSKITMLEGRLRRRVRETGAANLTEYAGTCSRTTACRARPSR